MASMAVISVHTPSVVPASRMTIERTPLHNRSATSICLLGPLSLSKGRLPSQNLTRRQARQSAKGQCSASKVKENETFFWFGG